MLVEAEQHRNVPHICGSTVYTHNRRRSRKESWETLQLFVYTSDMKKREGGRERKREKETDEQKQRDASRKQKPTEIFPLKVVLTLNVTHDLSLARRPSIKHGHNNEKPIANCSRGCANVAA